MSATDVFIPLAPSLIDINRLRPTIELIAALEQLNAPPIQILLTKVRANTRTARLVRDQTSDLGMPVTESEIPLLEACVTGFGMVPPNCHRHGALLNELFKQAVAA